MDLDIFTVIAYLEELKYVHYEASEAFNYLGDVCAANLKKEMADCYAAFIDFLMKDKIFTDLKLEEKRYGN